MSRADRWTRRADEMLAEIRDRERITAAVRRLAPEAPLGSTDELLDALEQVRLRLERCESPAALVGEFRMEG